MKSQQWIRSYEDSNVDVGSRRLRTNPDRQGHVGDDRSIADMVERRSPSPPAPPPPGALAHHATLHAMRYHGVDVFEVQDEIAKRAPASVGILTIPLAPKADCGPRRSAELDNNCQSILGYVVRWIDHGVGCSKVPDIHDVALMEDRATLRISRQLL